MRDPLDQELGLVGMDNVVARAKDAQRGHADLADKGSEIDAMQILDAPEKGLNAGARHIAKDHPLHPFRVTGQDEPNDETKHQGKPKQGISDPPPAA